MKLRVTHKYHSRRMFVENSNGTKTKRRVIFRKGETFDGTERELKQFGHRLERAEAAPAPADAGPSKKELLEYAEALELEVSDRMTKAQLQEAIEAAEKGND